MPNLTVKSEAWKDDASEVKTREDRMRSSDSEKEPEGGEERRREASIAALAA